MSPSGYEIQMYRDIGRAAHALEKIADSMADKLRLDTVAGRSTGRPVQDVFVQALRDRGADIAADRLDAVASDAAWETWFGPLLDQLEDLVPDPGKETK